MSVAQSPEPGGAAGPPRRLAAEVGTGLVVAAIVATTVFIVGTNQRDGAETATAAQTSSPSPAESASPSSPSPSEAASPDASPGEGAGETPEETPGGAETAQVTGIDLSVLPAEHTGRCPVTLEFSARITTNTGPVRAHYRWLDVDSSPVAEDDIQFGGPGPQGVTVTHQVEVPDDATAQRTLEVTAPNSVISDPAEATVTCTPYAEVTAGREVLLDPAGCQYQLYYNGTITVPHDMTVSYVWERSDGATQSVPNTLDFTSGGQQSADVQTTWQLKPQPGTEYSQRIKILSPYESTSNWATSTPNCP